MEARRKPVKVWLLRPFLARYRTRHELRAIPERLEIVYRNATMSADGRFLFVRNPKAACTTVAQLIYKYSTGSFAEDVHKQKIGVFQGLDNWRLYQAALQSPDSVVFTTVRHPEARILSAFTNFFVDRSNEAAWRHLRAIKAWGWSDALPVENQFELFLAYVQESITRDPLHTDRHWRAQHISIGYGTIPYDRICKVETLWDDLRAIFALAGEETFLDRQGEKPVFNRSSRPKFELTPAVRRRVREVYAKDFECFGYE